MLKYVRYQIPNTELGNRAMRGEREREGGVSVRIKHPLNFRVQEFFYFGDTVWSVSEWMFYPSTYLSNSLGTWDMLVGVAVCTLPSMYSTYLLTWVLVLGMYV